ncbi:inorganic phosphate transporter [Rhodobacteraceae bacterium B1Z28]|uniref:Phosphate transporter n=1 Tax=Ruegeria haliotis TaxID=2747601 RepID=A0ABX2PJ66_9RHOB|nr:inorganic phosphate transporter [Ruegeria haliotis]NVO54175.1 inorganic phosphate transporter [Ruegeria haliotis]
MSDSALNTPLTTANPEPSVAMSKPIQRIILCLAFIAAAVGYAYFRGGEFGILFAITAGFGAYMALNIGANDVANNVGPTVGAKVMTLGAALVMAAAFEALGAIVAGGNVVGTVRAGIVDPSLISDQMVYVWVMMAALLAAATWLNLATMVGAPVSTTHSIVGGVLGAGVAAAGFSVVNWAVVTNIVASWVVSPMLGAVLAAICLYVVKRAITYQSDILSAAKRAIPLLVAAMTMSFTTFLLVKGLKKIVSVDLMTIAALSFALAVVAWFVMQVIVTRQAKALENTKTSVNRLLAVPLILAAAALSFAHGSNDVANAIGPLAGIVDALSSGDVSAKAGIPFWLLAIGAIGLAIGLLAFGPRVIRTIGSELTHLDAIRAYCIAMAATLTVILASQLGLPVSTTHVTVGAVLGVGFLRERIKARYEGILHEIHEAHPNGDTDSVDTFLKRFHATPFIERSAMLKELKLKTRMGQSDVTKLDRKTITRLHKRDLVDRSLVLKIFAAWIITVPATAAISAVVYFTLRGIMLP